MVALVVSLYMYIYRLTVQYVADHWVTYKAHRLSCGDAMAALPPDEGHEDPRYSLNRLQLEFDQFVLRATKWILTAHKYDKINTSYRHYIMYLCHPHSTHGCGVYICT